MTAISSSWEQMLEGGSQVARVYLRDAIREIDAELGDGYAKAHPELVGVYMQVASRDMGTVTTAKVLGEALEQIADSVGRMSGVKSG